MILVLLCKISPTDSEKRLVWTNGCLTEVQFCHGKDFLVSCILAAFLPTCLSVLKRCCDALSLAVVHGRPGVMVVMGFCIVYDRGTCKISDSTWGLPLVQPPSDVKVSSDSIVHVE